MPSSLYEILIQLRDEASGPIQQAMGRIFDATEAAGRGTNQLALAFDKLGQIGKGTKTDLEVMATKMENLKNSAKRANVELQAQYILLKKNSEYRSSLGENYSFQQGSQLQSGLIEANARKEFLASPANQQALKELHALQQANKETEQALYGVATAAKVVKPEIDGYTKALQGAYAASIKANESARATATALNNPGYRQQLGATYGIQQGNSLQQRLIQAQAQQQFLSNPANQDALRNVKNLEGANRKLQDSIEGNVRSTNTLHSAWVRLGKTVSLYIVFMMARAAVQAFYQNEVAAMNYTKSLAALEHQTQKAGLSSRKLLDDLQEATMGQVSTPDMALQLNRAFALLGKETMPEYAKLANLAAKASQAMGITMEDALNRITLGIGRKSIRMLDELGILVRVGEANENYALKLNRNKDTLSDLEQQTAYYLEVLKQAEAKYGDMTLMDDPFARLGASVKAASTELGVKLLPYAKQFAVEAKKMAEAVGSLTEEQVRAITEWGGLVLQIGLAETAFWGLQKAMAAVNLMSLTSMKNGGIFAFIESNPEAFAILAMFATSQALKMTETKDYQNKKGWQLPDWLGGFFIPNITDLSEGGTTYGPAYKGNKNAGTPQDKIVEKLDWLREAYKNESFRAFLSPYVTKETENQALKNFLNEVPQALEYMQGVNKETKRLGDLLKEDNKDLKEHLSLQQQLTKSLNETIKETQAEIGLYENPAYQQKIVQSKQLNEQLELQKKIVDSLYLTQEEENKIAEDAAKYIEDATKAVLDENKAWFEAQKIWLNTDTNKTLYEQGQVWGNLLKIMYQAEGLDGILNRVAGAIRNLADASDIAKMKPLKDAWENLRMANESPMGMQKSIDNIERLTNAVKQYRGEGGGFIAFLKALADFSKSGDIARKQAGAGETGFWDKEGKWKVKKIPFTETIDWTSMSTAFGNAMTQGALSGNFRSALQSAFQAASSTLGPAAGKGIAKSIFGSTSTAAMASGNAIAAFGISMLEGLLFRQKTPTITKPVDVRVVNMEELATHLLGISKNKLIASTAGVNRGAQSSGGRAYRFLD
jgi:hypothetical protein